MSNTLLTPTEVTRESLRILHGNSAMLKAVNKAYDDRFAQSGAKIGDSLLIRKPNKYTVRTGRVMNVQDTAETSVTLTVSTQKGVDMSFTSQELALDLDDFSKRIIKPAISVLAANVDYDAMAMSLDVAQSVGTPGTDPGTLAVWGEAAAKLDLGLAPRDGNRYIILNPQAQAATVSTLSNLFHDGDELEDQYMNGVMQKALGFKWMMSQNVRALAVGSRDGSSDIELTAASVAEGATTLGVDDLTGATDTFKEGEVFTLEGVYAVNAETKQSTGQLMQFVLTEDETGVSNAATLTFQPPIYSTGALQNVSGMPADNANVEFIGTASTTYSQNLVFHKDAFTFATADLPMPRAAQFAAREVLDGISMRIWQGDDIVNDAFPARVDILYGYVATYPELACRVWGD